MGLPTSPMFCYGGIATCFGGLATSETLFACLGSLLTLMTFALRGVKDLYTTWQGTGLVASGGKFRERTCMKWALGNRSNSAVIGFLHVAIATLARPKHRDFTLSHHLLIQAVFHASDSNPMDTRLSVDSRSHRKGSV